jgi:hypothetical protein
LRGKLAPKPAFEVLDLSAGEARQIAQRSDADYVVIAKGTAQLAYHAFFGKVDPERLDKTWNFPQSWQGKDSLHTALEFLAIRTTQGKWHAPS